MIPEVPALQGWPPTWSLFVARFGGIDRPTQAEVLCPDNLREWAWFVATVLVPLSIRPDWPSRRFFFQ
jgi:hypothetical protein